ncbi:MAG: extracellular solute-binding protein [Actinobacteria bacterium]|nr:extracellular solute-binding protein [Actinomycetota bacterium]
MNRTRITRYAAAAGVAVVLASGLAACSSPTTAGGSTPAAAGAKGPVTFWGWAPGYKEAVAIWNKEHPDEKVTYQPIQHSDYTKMLTAVKAGNAPCLAQIGYQALPDFVVQKAVEDISSQMASKKSEFTGAGWSSVAIGTGVYGVPVDAAPFAMIYNKEQLAKYGITTPPATWEEYKDDAKKIHDQDPTVSLGYLSDDPTFWGGLAQQAGARWFTLNNASWTVSVNDAATRKLGGFWQSMVDEQLIPVQKSYTPALYKEMGEGKILSETFGIWDTAVLQSSLPADQAGKWAVAPGPTWAGNPKASADMGGSSTAVLKGCDNKGTAIDFATWMSTSKDSWSQLIKVGGLWPASTTGLANPLISQPVAFFGDEKIYQPFVDIAKSYDSNGWVWGPTMTTTNGAIADGMGAVTSSKTVNDVFDTVQSTTIDALKSKGLTVSK